MDAIKGKCQNVCKPIHDWGGHNRHALICFAPSVFTVICNAILLTFFVSPEKAAIPMPWTNFILLLIRKAWGHFVFPHLHLRNINTTIKWVLSIYLVWVELVCKWTRVVDGNRGFIVLRFFSLRGMEGGSSSNSSKAASKFAPNPSKAVYMPAKRGRGCLHI